MLAGIGSHSNESKTKLRSQRNHSSMFYPSLGRLLAAPGLCCSGSKGDVSKASRRTTRKRTCCKGFASSECSSSLRAQSVCYMPSLPPSFQYCLLHQWLSSASIWKPVLAFHTHQPSSSRTNSRTIASSGERLFAYVNVFKATYLLFIINELTLNLNCNFPVAGLLS